jgi:hypothetical protein
MPKQVPHDKNVILNSFQNLILNFGINLTFAWLCEVPPYGTKAGILNFGIFILLSYAIDCFLTAHLDAEATIHAG